MNRVPKIGDRIELPESLTHGPCLGTVIKIYPAYRYDDINDRETTELLPEREWHVCVKVDTVPARWPYTGTDLIAPEVSALRRIIR